METPRDEKKNPNLTAT